MELRRRECVITESICCYVLHLPIKDIPLRNKINLHVICISDKFYSQRIFPKGSIAMKDSLDKSVFVLMGGAPISAWTSNYT